MAKKRGGGGTLIPARLPISSIGVTTSNLDLNLKTIGPVTPQALGDLMVLSVGLFTGSFTVSAVSGGGVTTWTRQVAFAAPEVALNTEIWTGVVTSLIPAPITITTSTSSYISLMVQEFTTGDPTNTWYMYGDTGSGQVGPGGVFSWLTPQLTAQGVGETYFTFVASNGATIIITGGPTITPTQVAYNVGTYANFTGIAWYTATSNAINACFTVNATPFVQYSEAAILIYATV
jgi:hypothetical protein